MRYSDYAGKLGLVAKQPSRITLTSKSIKRMTMLVTLLGISLLFCLTSVLLMMNLLLLTTLPLSKLLWVLLSQGRV
jgi:hypothetical protein